MSLTKATYSLIDGQFINAADYGATGDGVTNDTAALNAAYAAAAAAKKELYIPAGNYIFTSQLVWDQNVNVIGQWEYTNLRKQGNFNGILITGLAAGCNFKQFNVIGQSGNGGSGIVIKQVSYVTLQNVGSFLHAVDGIYIQNTAGGDPNIGTYRLLLLQVNCSANGRDGIGLDNTGYAGNNNICNVCTFDTIVCNSNGRIGFNQYGEQSAGYHFGRNITCAENDGGGLLLEGIASVIETYTEVNTPFDVKLSSSSIRNIVTIVNQNTAYIDEGQNNVFFGAMNGIRTPEVNASPGPGNVPGRNLIVSSAPSLSTGAAQTGGTLFLYGGDAAGTSGSANGGIVRLQGGDGYGGGQKGPIWLQANGGGVTVGATTTPSASVLMRFESTTRAVQYVGMTTTQRNALTAAAGMLIFNSTTSKLQVYDGSNWVDLH